MRDNHLGEEAELYALGEVDDLTAAGIARHVRGCASCARRVGEAEATVLRLIESGDSPPRPHELDRPIRFGRPARTWAWAATVAAALLIGLLPWAAQRMQTGVGISPDRQAATAMLAGHFGHAPLRALKAGAPIAKVVYPREGGWLYVIVAPGATELDVAVAARGRRQRIASLRPSETTRTLFLHYPGRVDEVELLQAGAPVARAHVVY